MKYRFNLLKSNISGLAWVLLLVVGIVFSACEDDELNAPEIFGLRLTDPASIDSVFSGGDLGQNIVILGNNLGTTKQVFFNNVEAYINPNYIRNDNIILNVPTEVPTELNNEITVITDGGMATYPFEVEIPEPIIDQVSLEMVSPGDILTISGDFFFSSQVTIGGELAEVVSESQEQIVVSVPANTTGGELKITTLFGEGTYAYHLNDMGFLILDWEEDATRDCWQKLSVISADTDPKPVPMLTGNYGHVEAENMGQTGWFDPGVITTCGSAGISGDVANMAMKFEINLPEAVEAGYYQISIQSTWNYNLTLWEAAPFKTEGWQTVTIPLSAFTDGGGAPLNSADSIADIWFVFKIDDPSGVNPVFNWNIDNVRIVNMQ